MFQLITAGVVTNMFVKMCFILREMRHKYKAYYLPTLQCLKIFLPTWETGQKV